MRSFIAVPIFCRQSHMSWMFASSSKMLGQFFHVYFLYQIPGMDHYAHLSTCIIIYNYDIIITTLLVISPFSLTQKSNPPGAVGVSLALETVIQHSSMDIRPFRCNLLCVFVLFIFLFLFSPCKF